MGRWVAVLTIGMALALGGCAGMHSGKKSDAITKDTVIQCPKCGVEFPVSEGVEAHGK